MKNLLYIWFRAIGQLSFGLMILLLANRHLTAVDSTEETILKEVHRLRKQSDINIVMDYDKFIQWNPLFSYTTSEAQIHISLFEGVLSYNPVDMSPQQGLAKSWVQDDLRYKFYLRRNARFSNGETIDANTIAETWFFLVRSEAPFSSLLDLVSGIKAYREGRLSKEETGIKVLSPYVLELELEHPAPEILSILCHQSLSPLPPSMLREQNWPDFYRKLETSLFSQFTHESLTDSSIGDSGRPPSERLISNGAYQLSSVSEAGILLEANPYYWKPEQVASKKIFIQKYYEWQDLDISGAINSYKIDWVSSGFSNFRQLRRGLEMIHVGKSFGTTFFYFANSADNSNSWSDPRVRKALTLLLPLELLRSDSGGDAYLIPEMPNFRSGNSLEKQDKEEAMRLLEASGYTDGLGTLTLRFPEGQIYEQFAELIKNAWNNEELKSTVKVQYGNFINNATKNNEEDETQAKLASEFTLGVLSWIGDYPRPNHLFGFMAQR